MRNKKTLIKIIAIVLVCSPPFAGYLFLWEHWFPGRMMARPLTSWFKQQHAVFFDEDEVDIKY